MRSTPSLETSCSQSTRTTCAQPPQACTPHTRASHRRRDAAVHARVRVARSPAPPRPPPSVASGSHSRTRAPPPLLRAAAADLRREGDGRLPQQRDLEERAARVRDVGGVVSAHEKGQTAAVDRSERRVRRWEDGDKQVRARAARCAALARAPGALAASPRVSFVPAHASPPGAAAGT